MIEDYVLRISGVFGGLATIITFVKIFKPFSKMRAWVSSPITATINEFDTKNKKAHEELLLYVDELRKHTSEIDSKVLKLAICSPSLPLKERVDYGEEYVNKRHLNGSVKLIHEHNCEKYAEDLENEKR